MESHLAAKQRQWFFGLALIFGPFANTVSARDQIASRADVPALELADGDMSSAAVPLTIDEPLFVLANIPDEFPVMIARMTMQGTIDVWHDVGMVRC